ncbi:putative Golgi complex component Cog3 [Taphrina deformans PYCC 5710]|uniref:Conserved oligomeric Golgi complex subunit 3 n=1 Tax=Taphrina deformans (strain PYCC 5710 / ATCC 11124 / CBS 356.35 / IMI 108563 / JCM 9778 / NBRC 8474) TaxID=1097556 RepID=R4XAM5_TAPDE|nr:putative Golgi complex component Cog3 [Taphrina deformans PYCC 5710]|eukprot:CCG82584.1 putative Golgi complex component Cog3 [Taphrina deformans PYCC 5710]
MDDYAFSYVTHQNDALQPSSPKLSPEPTALKANAPRRPPIAQVRVRAKSEPGHRARSAPYHETSTNYEIFDRTPWYLDVMHLDSEHQKEVGDTDTDTEDELEDVELLTLKQVNTAQLASCREVLAHASAVLDTLNDIKNGFSTVKEQTSTLQTACNDLQREETRLQRLADDVRDSLQPFSYLATATRLLNVPGSKLVLQSSYQELLSKLQSSLDFLDQHPNYKDAEFYTREYRQALTKALTLARVYFATSMREISNDISTRTQVNAMNKNTQSALLYTKFRSVVHLVRPLVQNIEHASFKYAEYWSLLNDCWILYFNIRKSLLNTMITNAFKDLLGVEDFLAFSTSAISFMRILALDERELYSSFFDTGHDEFENFLAGLGQYFTDAIRPRIAAESSLSILCEVCGGMQSQCSNLAEDQESVVFDMTPILATTLGEIQNRIVLRAQGVVINEIQGYKPSDKDLDYPATLQKHRKRLAQSRSTTELSEQSRLSLDNAPPLSGINGGTRVLQSKATHDRGDLESLNSTVVQEKWYITLSVSISLLSKIYRLVQSSIFDDLAHEVVRSCIASLLNASNLIKRRKPIDGSLFLLKHLLILKEQLAAFDIEYNDTQAQGNLDLSTVTGAFWDLTNRSATELFAPTALYNLASSTLSRLSAAGYLSRKVENMSDAREELNDQTRLVIGTLTLHCADSVTVPLRSAMGNKSQSANDLVEANRKFRAGCPDSFNHWRESFEVYISDNRVVIVLLGIIQDKMLETYERFDTYARDLKKQKETDGESLEVKLPSVMETVDWLKGVISDQSNGDRLSALDEE